MSTLSSVPQLDPLAQQQQQDTAPVNVAGQPPANPNQPGPPADVSGLPASSRTAPQANVPVAQPKKSFFDSALQALAGGPVRKQVPDPNDPTKFKTVEVPQSRATLGQHILAGVLSGIFAGGGTHYENSPQGPVRVNDLSEAGAAGFKAGQEKQQEIANKPQQMDDQARARAVSTLRNNLDLHAAMINNSNHELDLQKRVVDENKDYAAAFEQYDIDNPPTDPSQRLVLDHGLTAQQALAHNEKVLVGNNAIIDGYVPISGQKNPDGTQAYEPTFMIINPYAKIALNKTLKDKIGEVIPGADKISDNALVDARLLVAAQNRQIEKTNAEGSLQLAINQNWENSGKKGEAPSADIKALLQGVPVAEQRKDLQLLGKLHGMLPDDQMKMLEKEGASPNFISNFSKQSGYTEKDWLEYRTQQKRQEGLQPIDSGQLAGVPASITAFGLTGAQTSSLMEQVHPGMSQNELAHVLDQAGKYKHENDTLAQNAVFNNKALTPPTGFERIPNAMTLSDSDLQNQLRAKGVPIPPDFQNLYALAHNQGDIERDYTNNPRKGSNKMTRADAATYIRNYINPQWDENGFKLRSKFNEQFLPGGQAGKSIAAASVAAHHIADAEAVYDAYTHHDITKLNTFLRSAGKEVGSMSDAQKLDAMMQIVQDEIGKVAIGTTPRVDDLKQMHDKWSADMGPDNFKAVMQGYVSLMAGRLLAGDTLNQDYNGTHLRGIDPVVDRVLAKYGQPVPWAGQTQRNQAQNAAFQTGQTQQPTVPANKVPAYKDGQVIGYADDKQGTNFVRFK